MGRWIAALRGRHYFHFRHADRSNFLMCEVTLDRTTRVDSTFLTSIRVQRVTSRTRARSADHDERFVEEDIIELTAGGICVRATGRHISGLPCTQALGAICSAILNAVAVPTDRLGQGNEAAYDGACLDNDIPCILLCACRTVPGDEPQPEPVYLWLVEPGH